MTSTASKLTFSLAFDLRAEFRAAARVAGRSGQSVLRELVAAYVRRQRAPRAATDDVERASLSHQVSAIAYASHELRNQLNALFGVLDTLAETPLSEEQAQYLDVASNAAQTMRSMVDRFLDAESAGAAAHSILDEVFNLRRLLDDVGQQYSHVATSSGVDLLYEVEASVPECVSGDPLRLRQVLANLLGNAFKFTKQGVISVVVRAEERDGAGTALCFQVRDTGIGMTAQQQRQAFMPYTLSGPAMQGRCGGSGLGLYLCRQIVQSLGGEIELESVPSAGSCVSFWVPLVKVEETSDPMLSTQLPPADPISGSANLPLRTTVVEAPAAPSTQPLRVLIVDDNETNRMVAKGMLSLVNCVIEAVGDGTAALKATRESEFDLILMDCGMPGTDGYQTTARIRDQEAQRGHHTVIVAMTGNTEVGAAVRCIDAGMDDYLAKPITLANVRRVLDKWLLGNGTNQHADVCDINRDTFDKLRKVLGATLPHALLPFLEDAPMYLDQLEAAVLSDDHTKAAATAHALKGASWNLGAEYLSALCAEAERLARTGELESIAPVLEAIRAAYSVVEPIFQSECARPGPPQAELRPGDVKKRALIVDDEASCRRMVRLALERGGFDVEEAVDGTDALDVLKRVRPDVILMDAIMPSLDGFMTCRLITQADDYASIPVVLVSGLDDEQSRNFAFQAGARDFFLKPINYATVAAQVRRHLA